MKQFNILLLFLFGLLSIWTVQACTQRDRDCGTPSGCFVRNPGDVCFTNGGYRCSYPSRIGPDNYCYA